MEAILTAYQILFNIQLELTGYKDDLRPFVKILPDKNTRELLVKYSMLQRFQKDSSAMLIEVEPQGVEENMPMFMPKDGEVFRYEVKFSSSIFPRTNLYGYNFDNQVLVLSNEVNHKVGSEILLSSSAPLYNGASEYKIGYLVQSGGTFYKALKESNSGDQHGTGEASYWKPITSGDTYVNQSDLKNRSSLLNPIGLDTIIMIEINHKSSLPADYQLLDGSLKCREVSYKIKLQNNN
ncbi:MAG TPA: hypothetical protein VFW11_21040 [Cyclobacteriaceae bacterium]|nr:hypothetical protein [Cyclobacteriaceae bacterium]